MDATALEDSIINIMRREHNATNTDEVIGATIVQTPKEDGTIESTVELERGTPPFNREAVVVLARAIAQAVVQHITSHADVDGGTWRIS